MAKPENPAEAPVNARPPRPVQRVHLDALPEAQRYIEPAHVARERRAMKALVDQAFDTTGSADMRSGESGRIESRSSDSCSSDSRSSDSRSSDSRSSDSYSSDSHRSDTTRDLEAPELHADDYLSDDDLSEDNLSEGSLSDGSLSEGSLSDGSLSECSLSEGNLSDGNLSDGSLSDGSSSEGVYDPGPIEIDAEEQVAEQAGDVHAGGSRQASAEPRPGLAWVRPASGSRTPQVPMASLERPSTSRIELTPSPVPRVALAPATGAVDISLVPGPNSVGSRNLPTLAAQHLIGRRQRRPAPAVPSPLQAGRLSREPGAAFALARDVRSSKGEIVLGLTIGLGVSLLLAGLGQAYLRGDIAVEQLAAEGEGAPLQLESVTLSARPEAAANSQLASPGSAPSAARPAAAREASPESITSDGSAPHATITANRAGAGLAHRGAPASKFGAVARGGDTALLAQAALPKRSELAPQRSTAPRATPARAVRARRSEPMLSAAPPATLGADGLAPVAGSSTSSAPSERAAAPSSPLTPAQSAGLGLDLPL